MLSSLLVPLSMLFANFATLATQLLVPRFLLPREYATFAVLWATGQFLASAGFEWSRLSVLRFSVLKDAERSSLNRQALLRAYMLTAATMISGAIAFSLLSLIAPSGAPNVSRLLLPAAAVLYYAACQGTFEGGQAIARAQFRNNRFSMGWLCRTAFSLVGALGAAVVTGSGTWTLIGIATSYPLSMALFWGGQFGRLKIARRPASREIMRFLMHYGIFAAVSTITSNFLPAAVRLLCTQVLPLGIAGGMLLALDLSQKALMVVGLAVNLVVMQHSIRAVEFSDDEARQKQLARQISIPFALILPSAIGFYLIQPVFIPLAVPETYRLVYGANIGAASLSAALLGLRLFSIDPLFIAAGRSRLTLAGPITSLLITFLAIGLIGSVSGYGDRLISGATALGLAAGLLVAILMVMRHLHVCWPYRDIAITLAAGIGMTLVYIFVSRGDDILSSVAGAGAAAITYGLICLSMNLCSIREILPAVLSRSRRA